MILGAVIALTMFSCGGNMDMNQQIVGVYNKYVVESEKLVDNVDKGTLEEREKTLAKLASLVDSCTTVVKEIKPTKEAEAFHTSTLEVYKVVAEEQVPVLKEFIAIDEKDESNANVDKYNKAIDKVNTVGEKVSKLEEKVLKVQEDFAKAIGAKLY